jgi:hypothetical protein
VKRSQADSPAAIATALLLLPLLAAVLLTADAHAATFGKPRDQALIVIPSKQGPGSSGMGAGEPYPYTVRVFGLPGPISDVNVLFGPMAHTHPNDIDVLLVGPRGQQAMLMSDTCGTSLVLNDVFTFDQQASSPLPQSGCTSGRYQPTNRASGMFGFTDPMPDPAPPPTDPAGLGIYPADLSAFLGTDPNGVWRAFAYDDEVAGTYGGTGGISGIEISLLIPIKCRGVTVTAVGANRRRDTFPGSKGRDVMAGLGGGDLMAGRRGNDLACGGRGPDLINGGHGRDVLVGGPGRDKLIGGKGRDLCIGGPGRDTARGCERRRGF